jgi:5'-nucleotidase
MNITRIIIGEYKLEGEKRDTVGTSDYFQRGTGYTSLSNNINHKYNAEYLWDALEEYLCEVSSLNDALVNRYIKNHRYN